MKPAGAERASLPNVAGPHDEFRRLREAAGFTKKGLSRAAGLSPEYVAQLERGNIANPSTDVRERLARLLDVTVDGAFASFPRDEVAARRARELEFYNAGYLHDEIAALVGVSASVVSADLRSMPGYKPRPTRRTFRPPAGFTTATAAAAARGLDLWTLCETIASGEIPSGRTVKVAEGLVHIVGEVQLDAYLANRPECERDGCTRRALVGSRACCGGHASGLAMRGSKRSYETRTRMSEGKKGGLRPDMRERIRTVFDDPLTGNEMKLAMQSGRRLVKSATISQRRNAVTGVLRGREAAPKARAAGVHVGPPVRYTVEQRDAVLDLRAKNPKLGAREIAKRVGLSHKQVRGILASATAVP